MNEKIVNIHYKAFIDGGLLFEINRDDIIKVLDNIAEVQTNWSKEKIIQARALIIIAWATGARPNEYLRLMPSDFHKSKEFLEIKIPGSKGGKGRTMSLPLNLNDSPDPLITELYDYITRLFETMAPFHSFISNSTHYGITKKNVKKTGEIETKHYDKRYRDLGSKLRYYFPRWFEIIMEDGIPPYYLRHNRGTIVTDNAGITAAAHALGHKSQTTTMKHYSHLTKERRRQIGKELMK